jgi:hypothetical protein
MKWLKETSVGPIRSGDSPNLVVQDGLKAYFLCGDFEQRLQKWETPFASNVFKPLHDEPEHVPSRIQYGPWALYFAVSVSWRVMKYHSENPRFVELSAIARDRVAVALQVWREFLLGTRQHPEEFEQHVVPFGLIEKPILGMSPFFNRYIERSIDNDIADNGDETIVYSKLGRILLFGVIPRTSRVREWRRATRISVRRGTIATKGWIQLPNGIAELLNSKAHAGAVLMSSLSDRQRQLADDRLRMNMQTNPDARLFKAYVRDYELFGDAALDPAEDQTDS